MVKQGGWEFYNLPKQMSVADYEQVLAEVTADLENNPGVESAYVEGSQWVPGISDIDILVALKPQTKRPAIKSPMRLSPEAKYVFIHHYGVYEYDVFKELHYFIPYNHQLRLLTGTDIKISGFHDLDTKEQKLFSASLVFDLLANKLLYLPKKLVTRRIDTRNMLGQLHSLTYTLNMMRFITNRQIDAEFEGEITDLRRNWFSAPQKHNLDKLAEQIQRAIILIFTIMIELSAFVATEMEWVDRSALGFPVKSRLFPVTPKLNTRVFLNNYKHSMLFADNLLSPQEYLEIYLAKTGLRVPLISDSLQDNFFMVLPLPLSSILFAYAAKSNALSTWLRNDLYTRLNNIPLLRSPAVARHISVMGRHMKGGQEGIVSKAPFPYGFTFGKRTRKQLLERLAFKALRRFQVLGLR